MTTADPTDPPSPAPQTEVAASGTQAVAVSAAANTVITVDNSVSSQAGVRFGDNSQFGDVQIGYTAAGNILVAHF